MGKIIRTFRIDPVEQAVYITECLNKGIPGEDTYRLNKNGLRFVSADKSMKLNLTLSEFKNMIIDRALELEDGKKE